MAADAAPTPPVLAGHALHGAKRALRDRVIAARDAIEAGERDAGSRAIAQRIAALPSFAGARCVLLTLPFRSEWNTRPLVESSIARGATVALPRVNLQTRMLELFRVEDPDADVEAGYRGILEPRPSLRRIGVQEVGWVLVPGVAFDASGRRLGYGGGYYDRLLALLAPEVPKIAGAFDAQVVAEIPAAPHDLRVDAIATPTRMLTVA